MNYLIRYFREQENHLHQQFVLIRQMPGNKSVHELRVAYKKWKAILRFAEDECNLNPPDETGTVQTFFRIAGIYRDAEMSEALLKQYSKKEKCLLPSFRQYLRALKSMSRLQCRDAAREDLNTCLHAVQQILLPALTVYTEEMLNDLIPAYTSRKWDHCLSMADHFSKNAHLIRKELKQIYYLLMLCPVNILFDSGRMKQLDQVLDDLGHWHDHVILHQRLRYFRKNMLVKGMEEYEQAVKLEEVLELERDGWLIKAEEGLKKICIN